MSCLKILKSDNFLTENMLHDRIKNFSKWHFKRNLNDRNFCLLSILLYDRHLFLHEVYGSSLLNHKCTYFFLCKLRDITAELFRGTILKCIQSCQKDLSTTDKTNNIWRFNNRNTTDFLANTTFAPEQIRFLK